MSNQAPARFQKENGKITGLYAIADTAVLAASHKSLFFAVEQALSGGARIVQYRDKSCDAERRTDQASTLAELCHAQDALFIINDDAELASRVDADGVHIGRDDGTVSAARASLGSKKLVGVSCYNDLNRAWEAERAGADYVAFGSFFLSAIKPKAPQATAELLTAARRILTLPIVAIGGITADNAGSLIQAGADAVAVISDVFCKTHIATAARRYAGLF